MALVVHAFDVETSGPRIGKHCLMSIGAACVEISRGHMTVLDRFFVTIKWPEGLVFDEKTRDFWRQNQQAFLINTTNTKPVKEAAQMLYEHIYEAQRKASLRKARYVLLTDNAYFDVPWIDWFLCEHTERGLPLRHNYFTGWLLPSNVVDLSERIQCLKEVNIDLQMRSFHSATPHDHTPLNDALRLAERYAYFRQALQLICPL
jgi:hypothetical protein